MVQSKTKVKLEREEVRAVIDKSLGLGANVRDITILEDGWFNVAWRIGFSRGSEDLVLKVGPPEDAGILAYEKDIMRAEVGAMKLVAQDKRIPVPNIVFDDFSKTILPNDFFLMQFVEGGSWQNSGQELSPETTAQLEGQLGEILAAINSYQGQGFGYWAGQAPFTHWFDCFRNMLVMLFSDARRYNVALPLSEQEVLGALASNQQAFDAIVTPRLVHWDLWAGNIIINEDRAAPAIRGVLDFERVFWGDPLAEYSFGQTDRAALTAGYGQDLFEEPGATIRRQFYDLYLHMVMVIEDGPRDMDDKVFVNWARGELRADLERLQG